MHKKAQISVGNALIGLTLFLLLSMGAFNFFFNYMGDNNVDLSDVINQTEFEEVFVNQTAQLEEMSGDINRSKGEIPIISATLDFFATGIDSIKAAWKSVDFMKSYLETIEKTPLGWFLPTSFWTIVGALLSIVLVLIVLGALWRYKLL